MPRWTVDSPTKLEFDGVVALRVRAISGSVAVVATEDRPCLDVAAVTGEPLAVSHEAGILTITYPNLSWEGLAGWLRPEPHNAVITVAVPKDCPTQLGVLNATAFVGGISANTSVKSLSGNITLAGLAGDVEVGTASGDVEAQDLAGRVGFRSVSGDLTLADGSLHRLDAKTVSGKVTADIALSGGGALRIATLSGGVTVRLPADASMRVDLRSTTGRVKSGFSGLESARGRGGSTLTGTIGSGSGQLSVTTMSGQVTLLERSEPETPPEDGGAGTEGKIR